MSIKESLEKIKPFYTLILSIIILSIFLGVYYVFYENSKREPLSIVATAGVYSLQASTTEKGEVIGSKTGKKYYFPWCSTVKRIKPANQVHFASIDLAKQSGYTAGGNCKGLE
jgi:hypothetical protein